jgi:quercetin dioxygenase-like cupin family protein
MRRRPVLLLAALLPLTLVVAAAATQPTPPSRVQLTPAQIQAMASTSKAAGTSGVSGIQTRVLRGDPNGPGLYTIQINVPAHTQIEAHRHPDQRVATVVSGTWYFGYGDKFDAAALKPLGPGSFYTEPAGEAHFARTGDSPVAVQITGVGPSATHYVDATRQPAAH